MNDFAEPHAREMTPTEISPSRSPAPAYRPHRSADAVRRMFADIAPTYDFLNHFLSANVDRIWRRAAIRMAEISETSRLLDVCTGTGDLAFEGARTIRRSAGGRVVATDFCPEMISLARRKRLARRAGDSRRDVDFGVADTLRLPFAESSFDVVTVAFGIRNVDGLDAALRELRRVIRPGGRAVILEFTNPSSALVRRLFGLYFNRVLPRIGRMLSAAPNPDIDDAYRYLPDSVSKFPGPDGLVAAMEGAGFDEVRFRSLTCGIAAIHVGARPIQERD